MIVLDTTGKSIQMVLGGTVTTNQLEWFSSWRDVNVDDYTPGSDDGVSNNTTDVTVVSAPASGDQRVIDYISIYNKDTAQAVVTVKLDKSGTERILWKGTIDASGKIEFVEGVGWRLLNGNGVLVGEAGTPGADGADGALTVSQSEINFGATPVDEATFTVTDAAINASHKIIACVSAEATSDAESDENENDSIIVSAVAGSGQFTVYARAFPGPVHGRRKLNYQYS